MGLNEHKDSYQEIAQAIKFLNIDKFQAYTNNIVIDFQENFGEVSDKPKTLLDNLSVMLKAKNKDPYLQSLFVSRIWEMFSNNKEQSKLLQKVALDLLPLLFLRERNEKDIINQIDLFFTVLDKEPHDVFITKIPVFVNLFQNPFFNNAGVVIDYLKNRKNGFDVIGHFKVKEQCYYQKEMLLEFIKYLIESNERKISVDALYKACNNITINSVCHCRGLLEVTWLEYSPKYIQQSLETLLMSRLSLDECHRDFIPMLIASKSLRESTFKSNNLEENYINFLKTSVTDFYSNCSNDDEKDNLFKILKRLNIATDAYSNLECKHYLERSLENISVVDQDSDDMIEFHSGKL